MNGRIIRYLEIKNCTLTEQNGKPALLAPEDAETERLKDNGFLQMPDGKWVHFLTKSEQQVIGEAGHEQNGIVFIGLKKNFYLLNLLFFCSPKRKEAKEKGASRGRLLANGLEVEATRARHAR